MITTSVTARPPITTSVLEASSSPRTLTITVLATRPDEREHVAVREVDQLQDAVDERVAERDDAVDRAVREADQADVDELRRRLDEVDDEPEDDERDERQADQVGDARAAKLGE